MLKHNRILLVAMLMTTWMGCHGNQHGGSTSSSSSTGNTSGSGTSSSSGNTGGMGGEGGTGGIGGAGGEIGIGGMGGTGGAGGLDPNAIKFVHAQGLHVCMMYGDNRLKCWGANVYGELGLGDTNDRGDNPNELGANLPAIDFGAGKLAVNHAAGEVHNAVLLDNGQVKVYGNSSANSYGDSVTRGDEPGEMGDNLPAVDLGPGRVAKAVGAGHYHTCAILIDDKIKCWGNNFYGKLGLGNTTPGFGDGPNEMGDNLPAVDLGTDQPIVGFSAGHDHSCVLFGNGSIKCWGKGSYGELGLGDPATRGDEANEMGNNLPTVNLGTGKTAVAISAGAYHTCAILNDGSVKCWGYNASGQLGLGDTNDRGDQPGEMGDNLPTVDLGAGKTAVAIGTGYFHSCAVLNDGTLKCWGGNKHGNLGLGDTNSRGDGPNEMGDNLPPIDLGSGALATAVTGGNDVTCVVLQGNALKCFGNNQYGGLGLGDKANHGDGPNEMGDNLPVVVP